MNAAGTFFLVLFILLLAGGLAWVAIIFLRAKRAGLPPPPIKNYNPFKLNRSSSTSSFERRQNNPIKDWFADKLSSRRKDTDHEAQGQFERLDDRPEDNAWDSRYEQEPRTSYEENHSR